jgi:hypothetical protein
MKKTMLVYSASEGGVKKIQVDVPDPTPFRVKLRWLVGYGAPTVLFWAGGIIAALLNATGTMRLAERIRFPILDRIRNHFERRYVSGD